MASDDIFAKALEDYANKIVNRNPWYGAGQALQSAQIIDPDASFWENAASSAITGLAGGLMRGYGESEMEDEYNSAAKRLSGILGAPNNQRIQLLEQDTDFQQYAPLEMRRQQLENEQRAADLEKIQAQKALDTYKEIQQQYLKQGKMYVPASDERAAQIIDLPGIEDPAFAEAKAKRQAELEAQKQFGLSPEDVFKREESLRREMNSLPVVTALMEAKRTYPSILASYQSDSPTATIDLITGVAKLLDPGSVVREGETDRIIRSGGVFSQLQGWLEQARGTGVLDPAVKNELLNIAKRRMGGLYETYIPEVDRYSQIVNQFSGNLQNVLPTIEKQNPFSDFLPKPETSPQIDVSRLKQDPRFRPMIDPVTGQKEDPSSFRNRIYKMLGR